MHLPLESLADNSNSFYLCPKKTCMHLPLESLADNSCFHCTKILFHAMENKVSYQGK